MKELVKAIGESRVNGNGETPTGMSPRLASRSSSPKMIALQQPRDPIRSSSPQARTSSPVGEAERTSRSSSPVPIPGMICICLLLHLHEFFNECWFDDFMCLLTVVAIFVLYRQIFFYNIVSHDFLGLPVFGFCEFVK